MVRFHARHLVPAALLASCLVAARADDPPPADAPAPAAAEAAAARRVIAEAIDRAQEQAAAEPLPAPQAVTAPAPQASDAAIPQDLVIAKLSAEVAAKQLEAKRVARRSPAEAMAILDAVAAELAQQNVPPEARSQLERRIERTRRDVEESTGKRRAEIALDQKNAKIEAQIDRERSKRVEVDERLAMLVEEYNVLVDERRFPEAEAIAKKAAQLAPDNPVVRQLLAQSRMVRRLDAQKTIEGAKQTGFLDDTEDAERASAPFVGPIAFPETKDWEDLTKNRSRLAAEGRRGTPAELAIQKKLGVQVRASYRNEPLAAVLAALAKQADVPIHLDMVGLEGESVRSDTPVTISLDQPISQIGRAHV